MERRTKEPKCRASRRQGTDKALARRPLRLRLYPDTVLRQIARSIHQVDRHVAALARDMVELMYAERGIGLAAPQVGLLVRLIVADIGEGPIAVVNPRIMPGGLNDRMAEGCLSLPGVVVEVARETVLEVRGLAPDGARVHFEAKGLLARVLQHEVDHLDGVLICDYATACQGSRNSSESTSRKAEHHDNGVFA